MKIIINILMLVLVAGCSTKVPIDGTYDMSFNIPFHEEDFESGLDKSESAIFGWYKGNPQVVDFITEIDYPDFIYIVHYLEGNEEDERAVWEIREIDTNHYKLIFGSTHISTIELIYDPVEEVLSSKLIKYKKR